MGREHLGHLVQKYEESVVEGKSAPDVHVGDLVKVYYRIVEGTATRIQVFEGFIIAIKGSSVRRTFTVRKISSGIGVERIFPLYSPKIDKVEVVYHGRVRRSKLYYLRERVGKSARIRERVTKKN